MSDILSGGRIDESTSGPIPSKDDDRKRDILAEQRETQRQDAIGGTEEPPKPKPPEQIPEPPQVAPPLPVIPAFDFSIAGSALEETREIARQTVVDVIKNVTINGQGPSIEGSNISFNIPQQPPASEVFLFQGVAIPQSQIPQIIQTPAIPQPQTPQLEPVQEIQSIVVAPPPRTRQQAEVLEQEPQESPIISSTRIIAAQTQETEIPSIEIAEQRIEEAKILTTPSPSIAISPRTEEVTIEQVAVMAPQLQPVTQEETQVPQLVTTPTISVVSPQEEEPVEQPRITTTPSISITVPQEEVEQPQEPTPQPARSVSAQVPQAEVTELAEPQVPAISSTQQQPPLPLKVVETETTPLIPETSERPTTQDSVKVVPVQEIDIQLSETVVTTRQPEQPRSINSEDFGTGGSSAFLQSVYSEGRLQSEDFGTGGNEDFLQPAYSRGRLHSEDFGTAKGMEDTSSRDAYAEASEKRREKQEADPNFDRESDIRQKGESPREFKERQEQLKEEREQRIQAAQEKEEFFKRVRSGDITEPPSGIIPVEFTRADGQRKILAFVATEFVATTEGAVEEERVTSLPATNSYFIAGAGRAHPFEINVFRDPDSDPEDSTPTYLFTIGAGSINSLFPSGIFDGDGLIQYTASNSLEYVILNASSDGEQITSAQINIESSAPEAQIPVIFGLPSEAKFLIGLVYKSQAYQVQFTNFTVTGKQQFITSKVDAGVGELPYEIHYVWG